MEQWQVQFAAAQKVQSTDGSSGELSNVAFDPSNPLSIQVRVLVISASTQ